MLLPNRIFSIIQGKFRNIQRNPFSTPLPLEYLLNKLLNSQFWTERRGWLSSTGVKCSARHPLLCVTMASSGLAATDRQLYRPPRRGCQVPRGLGTAAGPGAPPWAGGLLHLQGLGLGLGPEFEHWTGPGPGPGHCPRYSRLSYCPCCLLVDPISLSVVSQGTPGTSNVFLLWFPFGREPCGPVHLLYFMAELQWGGNRKKTTVCSRIDIALAFCLTNRG